MNLHVRYKIIVILTTQIGSVGIIHVRITTDLCLSWPEAPRLERLRELANAAEYIL